MQLRKKHQQANQGLTLTSMEFKNEVAVCSKLFVPFGKNRRLNWAKWSFVTGAVEAIVDFSWIERLLSGLLPQLLIEINHHGSFRKVFETCASISHYFRLFQLRTRVLYISRSLMNPPQKLPLANMHERHPGLTPAKAESYLEAARVCLDRHHASPTIFNVKNVETSQTGQTNTNGHPSIRGNWPSNSSA